MCGAVAWFESLAMSGFLIARRATCEVITTSLSYKEVVFQWPSHHKAFKTCSDSAHSFLQPEESKIIDSFFSFLHFNLYKTPRSQH